MGLRSGVLGFRVQGLGFWVLGWGLGVWNWGHLGALLDDVLRGVQDCRVEVSLDGVGLRVQGVGCRV